MEPIIIKGNWGDEDDDSADGSFGGHLSSSSVGGSEDSSNYSDMTNRRGDDKRRQFPKKKPTTDSVTSGDGSPGGRWPHDKFEEEHEGSEEDSRRQSRGNGPQRRGGSQEHSSYRGRGRGDRPRGSVRGHTHHGLGRHGGGLGKKPKPKYKEENEIYAPTHSGHRPTDTKPSKEEEEDLHNYKHGKRVLLPGYKAAAKKPPGRLEREDSYDGDGEASDHSVPIRRPQKPKTAPTVTTAGAADSTTAGPSGGDVSSSDDERQKTLKQASDIVLILQIQVGHSEKPIEVHRGADPRVVAEEFCKHNKIKLPFAATIEKLIRDNVKAEELAPPLSHSGTESASSVKALSPRSSTQTETHSHSDLETSESAEQPHNLYRDSHGTDSGV